MIPPPVVPPGLGWISARAPAKINLALEVLRRRDDGYHDVATVLQAVSLADDLTVVERPEEGVSLRVLPRALDLGPAEANLVTRAALGFLGRWPLAGPAPRPGGLDILLRKRIPAGAGLGGGSADAAATLIALRHLAETRGSIVGSEELLATAAALGSDVPFFLDGGTQFGTGRGDRLSRLPDWPGKPLVLVFPNVGVATSSIYGALKMPLTPSGPLATISHRGISGPLWERDGTLPTAFRNDLEPIVADRMPAVSEVLNLARSLGCTVVRVTGSGSGSFCVSPGEHIARDWSTEFRKHGFWTRVVRPVSWGVRVGRVHRR